LGLGSPNPYQVAMARSGAVSAGSVIVIIRKLAQVRVRVRVAG